MSGVNYTAEMPKRSRQLVWRAAVERSKTVSQLALQVCLNIPFELLYYLLSYTFSIFSFCSDNIMGFWFYDFSKYFEIFASG